MNKYILEIGTEELAYKFIPSAMEQLKKSFTEKLNENKIIFDDIKVYATPRRLAVIIEGLPEKQEDTEKTVKGPVKNIAYDENGELTKAALGFAAKNGISSDKLFEKDNYVWAKIEQKGKKTEDILAEFIPSLVLNLKGTNFMRWGYSDIKFQRPIRNIVSLWNDKVLPLEIAGVTAGNVSFGHRFSNVTPVIKNPDTYLGELESACVIADVDKRRQKIVETATQKAKEEGAEIIIDKDLLEEVTFITEWPVPVVCSFDEEYLRIPEKVAVTVMAVHQRYFPLYKNGKLLNKFITLSNYIGDTFDNIKAGNERVVKARLEDAVFFVNEDSQKPLISYVDDLKGMTFQKDFGSLYDKTQRIIKLSEYISKKLNVDSYSVERTALLCKADLVTKLVFEFTELQGYIGSDYALRSGESEEVATGIKEHYYPLNAESELAESIEGQIVGIADKIDTVCAIFASGAKISGSQDPLGVRRATFGILKTVIQKNLKADISELIGQAIKLLPVESEDENKLYSNIKEFFEQRLIVLLSDKYRRDVLEACISSKDVLSDLTDFIQRVEITENILNNSEFSKFDEGIKRVIRIIKNESDFSEVNPELLSLNEEKNLYNAVKSIDEQNVSYEELQKKLFGLVPFITAFFDKVLVMDENEKIKQNRLNLLNLTKSKFDKIADFGKTVV